MGKTASQLALELLQGAAQGWYNQFDDIIPMESYRIAIVSYDPSVGSLNVDDILAAGKSAGWRVLKAHYIAELVPAMEGFDSFMAYVRPDVMPMTLGSLLDGLEAQRIIIAKGTVDEGEKLALDALWMAEGYDPVPSDPEVGLRLPVAALVMGGLVLLGAGWWLFGREK
jgi:hypothetical protein